MLETSGTHPLDLVPTQELVNALERRFDHFVFAGTIALTRTTEGATEQRVVRVKGSDLVHVGLLRLLSKHCDPQPLPAHSGPIGATE